MRTARTAASAVFAAALVGLGAGPAAAEDAVIESYGGERPDNAEELLAPLLDELSSRGYLVGAGLAGQIDQQVSRSGDKMSAAELSRAKGYLEAADEAFVRGEWKRAVDEASRGIDVLMAEPAALAGDEELRRQHRHGLIIVAESHRRLGNAQQATQAMAEMIRGFPTNDISSARYSPAVTKFFNQTRRDLDKQGKGTLEVKVDDPATVVFVNERYVGVGRVSLDAIPGTYRVLTRKGSESGRLHIVQVEPDAEVTLSISWPLDAALTTRGDYVGLEHASDSARAEHEARNAIKVARQIDASGVVVVGIREHDGRRSIVGQVLSLDSGKAIRTGTIAIEPVEPRGETIRNLGRHLAGDTVEGFEPTEAIGDDDGGGGGGLAGPGPVDTGSGRPFKTWKWVATVFGVAAIGGGVTMIAIDNTGGDREETLIETKVPGIVTTAVGAAVTGLGVYFFVRDKKDSRTTSVSFAPTRDGAVFSVVGRF